MKILEFVYRGIITYDWSEDFQQLLLVDEDKKINLVKKLRAVFDLYENAVSVSYFVGGNKLPDNEIQEIWLKKLFGAVEAEFETSSYHYSEHTFGTEYNTYLTIGGHDLFNELRENSDKWCLLKISVKVNDEL